MWNWKKTVEHAEVCNLRIENSNLKQTIALARKLESDLRAANAYETEIWEKRCSGYLMSFYMIYRKGGRQ